MFSVSTSSIHVNHIPSFLRSWWALSAVACVVQYFSTTQWRTVATAMAAQYSTVATAMAAAMVAAQHSWGSNGNSTGSVQPRCQLKESVVHCSQASRTQAFFNNIYNGCSQTEKSPWKLFKDKATLEVFTLSENINQSPHIDCITISGIRIKPLRTPIPHKRGLHWNEMHVISAWVLLVTPAKYERKIAFRWYLFWTHNYAECNARKNDSRVGRVTLWS